MMSVPDAAVVSHRRKADLDETTKDALLEVGNMTGGAINDTMRSASPGTLVQFFGCQGVRANVRPAFPYAEGDQLVVGRAQARIHEFPAFELIVMFPRLPQMA